MIPPVIDNKNGVRPCRRGLKPATCYLTPEARKQLLWLAWKWGKPIEHIMREGLDSVFAKNGLPEIARIPRKGEPA